MIIIFNKKAKRIIKELRQRIFEEASNVKLLTMDYEEKLMNERNSNRWAYESYQDDLKELPKVRDELYNLKDQHIKLLAALKIKGVEIKL